MYSDPPVFLTLFTLKRNVSVYSLFKTDHLVKGMGIGNYITIPKLNNSVYGKMFKIIMHFPRLMNRNRSSYH